MYKNLFFFGFIFCAVFGYTQIPTGYYDHATGSGYILKTQLKRIINDIDDPEIPGVEPTHNPQSYGDLKAAYALPNSGYIDDYFENDGSVLDMYSELPSSVDAYNFNHSDSNLYCGNPTIESDCLSREHTYPQGFFNSQEPMRSDIHFVIPADAIVNNRRANSPFGEVSSPTWTSINGSKLGPNSFPGFSGTVFEPLDEFKGDIARCLLYFAVRYEDQVLDGSWDVHNSVPENVINGTTDQFYEQWFINLLISWHNTDSVSARETAANNNAYYNHQNNRNPFIDNPSWVEAIWTSTLSVEETVLENEKAIYPNPANDFIFLKNYMGTKVSIYNTLGQPIFESNVNSDKFHINTIKFKRGLYFIHIQKHSSIETKRIIIK